MIIKHIANPKAQASKAARIGSLVDYIEADGADAAQKTEYIGASGNFYSESLQGQRAEMVALAMEAIRSKDPVDHWLISWKEGEQPTHEQCRQAVGILKERLGLSDDHLALYALHRNTENYHLHIVMNRVDPRTARATDKGWCIDKAHMAIAEIVHLQGWENEENARYIVDCSGRITSAWSLRVRQPRIRARDYENSTGEKSFERIAIESASPVLVQAESWQQVHEQLARAGMRYEQKGSGAIIWVEDQPVKASVIGREFSRKRMEERLGAFQPDRRTGAINNPRKTDEPSSSDKPKHWAEYRKTNEQHRQRKDAAVAQQRTEHRAARTAQLALFRDERTALFCGGNWQGNSLNVARSLLAAEHAKRKAKLMEQQKQERDNLRQDLGRRLTFEQFLVAQGEPQLASAWRYRHTPEAVAAILGNTDEPPQERDIRDFVAHVKLPAQGRTAEIHYCSKERNDQTSFIDRGSRIDVCQIGDHAAVLAALQLGAQKYGAMTIAGSPEFKHLCAELAAQHGFRITNPEMRNVAANINLEPSSAAPQREPTPLNAYRLHKADILRRIEIRNASQLDWMIAVRMRVTGHNQQTVASVLKEVASQGRESEARNWSNYAERTAQAAFGPRGEREFGRNQFRAENWTRLEGRNPAEELRSKKATSRTDTERVAHRKRNSLGR